MTKVISFLKLHFFKITISLICIITGFNFYRSTQINEEGHWGIRKHEPNGSLIHIAKDSPQIWARTKVYSYLKLRNAGVKLINVYSEKHPFDQVFATSLGKFKITMENEKQEFNQIQIKDLKFIKLDFQRSGAELYFAPSKRKITNYAYFQLNEKSYLIPEEKID